MAITTDYDAPRRSTVEDADTESLGTLTTARKDAQSPLSSRAGEVTVG